MPLYAKPGERQYDGTLPFPGIVYCSDCGAPIIDTPTHHYTHRIRVHSVKIQLERLPTTKPAILPHEYKPRISEEDSCLCGACLEGNCLACDGGECRCVCALEMDEIRVRR